MQHGVTNVANTDASQLQYNIDVAVLANQWPVLLNQRISNDA